jgi:hypothetical protein
VTWWCVHVVHLLVRCCYTAQSHKIPHTTPLLPCT